MLFVLFFASVASAATFTVSNTNATGPGSLVDAISQANAIAGPHTINITASGTMNVTTPLVLTQSMTINGPAATPPAFTIDGGNSTRIIQVSASAAGPMTLSGITLTHGRVDSAKGGAIDVPAGRTLNLTNCFVIANSTTGTSSADTFLSAGGAISTAGTLNIQTSMLSNNTSTGPGAAIYSAATATVSIVLSQFIGNQATNFAGAMYCSASVLITITNTTFFGNQSGTGGSGAIGFTDTKAVISGCTFSGNTTLGAGGAIVANARTGATIGIENSTFSGNTADFAGAFYAQEGTTDLRNVTITANSARRAGGGFNNPGPATRVVLRNSIVAGNTVTLPGDTDCSGPVLSNGYNLIGSTDGCTGLVGSDLTGSSPALAPLSINGGFTLTHLPFLSSAALEGGNPAGCLGLSGANLTVDQRGLSRPFGARCDIGSVELQVAAPIVPPRHRAAHH
ncbi:MAG TPA: choice-of-anchor Q domain-containing protein [Thermoanaerobaculia bacterium]|nr:choice-of-anchor Q domain-containing protein [Thermoanaerobaculia bacterium]